MTLLFHLFQNNTLLLNQSYSKVNLFYKMAEHHQQKDFETAVVTVNSKFPNQVKGRPLLDRWPECQTHIEQALSLAKTFQNHSKDLPPLETLPELGELLKNCVW